MDLGPEIFFSLSRPISSRFSKKYRRKEVFYNFEFFCYFFRNFLNRVEYERNSGLKFFFLVLGLSHPVLDRNIVGKGFFFIFLFFLLFFLEFSCRGRVCTEFGTKFFFSLSRPISSRFHYK